ncbi:hypothetical protein BP6252_05542 [Coleophoma cylindrospora]|uniref:Thioesterase domain-containing protein n=1 Tax=Coleophoma cylindrospora TaxID=1849047 RepID=A0A3D8RTW3_9HELO|nr:hypothetical protein BP6252_05542 [Coleophoma cylindrospora]
MVEPDLSFFQSIDWCRELIANPDYEITPTLARQPKNDTEDELWAVTLKTPSTFSHCISFTQQPISDPRHIPQVRMLINLGAGLNGHSNICHGGIISTILDDAMGFLLVLNRNLKGGVCEGRSTSTASLNVTFLKPVETPQIVLIQATLEKFEGRKYFCKSEVKSSTGVVLAQADALWITHRSEAKANL